MIAEQKILTDAEHWTPRYSSATWPSASILSPLLLTLFLQSASVVTVGRISGLGLGSYGTACTICSERDSTASGFIATETTDKLVDGETVLARFVEKLLRDSTDVPIELQNAISANLFSLL